MMKSISPILIVSLIALNCEKGNAEKTGDCFRAAVYEHVPGSEALGISSEEAIPINLGIYAKVAKKAKDEVSMRSVQRCIVILSALIDNFILF